jgi:hypothetical protein
VSTSLQSLSLPEASHLGLSEVQLPCVDELNASNVENENDADNASADAFIGSFSTDDRGQGQKDPKEETDKVQKEADEASKGEANEALQTPTSSLPHVHTDNDLRPALKAKGVAEEASKAQKETDEASESVQQAKRDYRDGLLFYPQAPSPSFSAVRETLVSPGRLSRRMARVTSVPPSPQLTHSVTLVHPRVHIM